MCGNTSTAKLRGTNLCHRRAHRGLEALGITYIDLVEHRTGRKGAEPALDIVADLEVEDRKVHLALGEHFRKAQADATAASGEKCRRPGAVHMLAPFRRLACHRPYRSGMQAPDGLS